MYKNLTKLFYRNSIFILIIIYWLPSCKKEEIGNKLEAIGSISAHTSEGGRWPNSGDITQVSFRVTTLPNSICDSSFIFFTTNMYNLHSNNNRFNQFFILFRNSNQEIQIKRPEKFKQTNCSDYPYASFSYINSHGDALTCIYEVDTTKQNYIKIDTLTESTLKGSFHVHWIKISGFDFTEYKDSIEVICDEFVAKYDGY